MANLQLDGYLALPSASEGHGVLVLHAWWGLNDSVRDVCERLAESGYLAFAPDLYQGKIATTIPDAERLSGIIFKDLESASTALGSAVPVQTGRSKLKHAQDSPPACCHPGGWRSKPGPRRRM